MRVVVGLGFGQLAPVYQGLHIRVIAAAVDEPPALKVVDARIACVHPVAVTTGVDEEGSDGAVRLLLG